MTPNPLLHSSLAFFILPTFSPSRGAPATIEFCALPATQTEPVLRRLERLLDSSHRVLESSLPNPGIKILRKKRWQQRSKKNSCQPTSHRRPSTAAHIVLLVTSVRVILRRLISPVVSASRVPAKPVVASTHVATNVAPSASAMASRHAGTSDGGVVGKTARRLNTLVHRRRFAGCT